MRSFCRRYVVGREEATFRLHAADGREVLATEVVGDLGLDFVVFALCRDCVEEAPLEQHLGARPALVSTLFGGDCISEQRGRRPGLVPTVSAADLAAVRTPEDIMRLSEPIIAACWGSGRSLRPEQARVVGALCSGQNVLAVLPTGYGKSLCYQLPALLMQGLVLVISPLVSLINDQLAKVLAMGIDAASLPVSRAAEKVIFERMEDCGLRLLYVSPEYLVKNCVAGHRFYELLRHVYSQRRLVAFALDEAHLLSDWGQGFRKTFRRLSVLQTEFPTVPCAALTGTATLTVEADIAQTLFQKGTHMRVRVSLDRPNIFLRVVSKPARGQLVHDMCCRLRSVLEAERLERWAKGMLALCCCVHSEQRA